MVENTPKTLNIFFSRANNDETQFSIYSSLCEKYDDNDKICIIDVDDKYDGVNDKLCEGILREIKKCDIFICILTPIYNEDREKYINNNVLFELGYAYSCIDKKNIYIFIKDDENIKRDFEMLCPSMLSSIKYKTYTAYEDIDIIIQKKYNDFKGNYDNNFNEYILLDKNVVSLIKYEISQTLNNDNNIEDKLSKLEYYIENYKHNDIIEIVFLFIAEYINNHQLAYYVLDWFFDFLSNKILDNYWYKWIYNKNNQIKILNLLRLIQYQLFEKYRSINKVKINTNRRNFAIIIFELLKTKIFAYKNELDILLNNSINHNINGNYEIFIYKLKSLHNCKNNNEKKEKREYYEDLILDSKNSYNTYYVMHKYNA
jgi:hypothetical protein